MTTGEDLTRPPAKTDAEWARSVENRLRKDGTTVRAGDWVLSTKDGKLVASTPGEEIVLSEASNEDYAKSEDVRGAVHKVQTNVDEVAETAGDALPRVVFDAITPGGRNIATDPTMSTASLWNDTARETYQIAGIGYWGFKSLELTVVEPELFPRAYIIRDSHGDPAELIVTEGDKFDFSVQVRSYDGNAGTTDMRLQVVHSDSTGVLSQVAESTDYVTPPDNGWAKISMDVVVPDGYDTTAFMVQVKDDALVGDVYYIDNPILLETTKPTNLAEALFGQKQLASTILQGVVPGLPQDRIDDLPGDLDAKTPREVFDAITPGGRNIATDPTMSTAALWEDTARESYEIADIGYWGFKSLEMTCLQPANECRVHFIRNSRGEPAALIVTPGDKFDFSAYVRGKAGNVAGQVAKLRVHFTDSAGVLLPTESESTPVVPSTSGWSKLNLDVVVPDGYDTAAFSGYVQTTVGVGDQYYWDTPTIRETTAPTNIAEALFGQKQVATTILEDAVPELPQGKITNLEEDLAAAQAAADVANALLAAKIQAGQSVCTNPGFEDTDQFLHTSGETDRWEYSSAQTHGGSGAIEAVAQSPAVGLYAALTANATDYVKVNGQAGQVFYTEFFVYGKSTNTQTSGAPDGIRLILACHDASNTWFTTVYNAYVAATTDLNGVWTKVSGYIELPANTVRFRPMMYLSSNVAPAGETYYVDDVSVIDVTDAYLAKITADTALAAALAAGETADAATPREIFDAKTPGGKNIATDPTMSTAALWNDDDEQSYAIADIGYWGFKSLEMTCLIPASYCRAYFVRDSNGDAAELIVSGGDKFDFSVQVRAKAGNSIATYANLQVIFKDSTGVLSQTVQTGPSAQIPVTGSWKKISMDVVVPSGYDTAAFHGYVGNDAGVGDVFYWDSPWILETTAPTNLAEFLFGQKQFASTILDTTIPTLAQGKIQDLPADMEAKLPRETFDAIGPGGGWNAASDPTMSTASLWNDTSRESYGIASIGYWGFASLELTCLEPENYPRVYFVRNSSGDPAQLLVTEGDKFDFSAYVRRHASASAEDAYLTVAFTDSTGVADPAIQYQTSTRSVPSSSGWTKLSMDVIVPSGYDTAAFYGTHDHTVSVGDVYYWDNPVIKETTAPTNIAEALFGQKQVATTIVEGAVPELPQDKVTGLEDDLSDIQGALEDHDAEFIDQSGYIDDLQEDVVRLNAMGASGSNLVPDPSCEDTSLDSIRAGFAFSSAGTGGAWSHDDAHFVTGTRSIKFVYGGAGYPSLKLTTDLSSNPIPVRPGQVFFMAQQVWVDSSNTGTGQVLMFLACLDNDDGPTSYPGGDGLPIIADTGEWVLQEQYIEIPANCYEMYPYFASVRPGNDDGDTFWFDSFQLYEVTDASKINQALFGQAGPGAELITDAVPVLPQSKVTDLTTDLPAAQSTASTALTNAATAQAEAEAKVDIDLFTASMQKGSNLVVDPQFTNDDIPRSAYGSGGAYSTDVKRGGTYSYKWTADGTLARGMYFNIDTYGGYSLSTSGGDGVEAGDVFYHEVWIYSHAANNHAGVGSLGMTTRWVDSTGALANAYSSDSVPIDEITPGTWTKLSYHATCPDGYNQAVVFCTSSAAVASGNIYYADTPIWREVTQGYVALTAADEAESAALAAQLDADTANKSVTAKATAGSNMVMDPQVTDPALWACTSNSGGLSTDYAHSGTHSYKWVTDGVSSVMSVSLCSDSRALSRTDPEIMFKVREGEVYYCEGWLLTTDAGSGTVRFRADQYDSSEVLSVDVGSFASTPFTAAEGEWTKVSGTVTIGAGYDRLSVFFYTASSDDAGTSVYADDLLVREITNADAAQDAADTAQGTANTAVSNAATADAKAVTAQGVADIAKVLAKSQLAGGANLIGNPGFENAEYYHGHGVQSSEQAHSGTYSRKYVQTGTYGIIRMNTDDSGHVTIPCRPSDVFYLEAWVYAPASNTAVDYRTWFQFYWLDEEGGKAGVGTAAFVYPDDTPDTWVKMSAVITAPSSNVVGIDRMWLVTDIDATPGNVYYFDDVIVQNITEAYNAQLAADAAQDDADTAQGTANTAVTNAATAQAAADAAQAAADAAQAALVSKITSGNNLCTNPGFENTDFYAGGLTYSTEEVYEGDYSLKYTAPGGGGNDYRSFMFTTLTTSTYIDARGGDHFYFEFMLFPHASNNAGSSTGIRFYLRCNDKDGSRVTTPHQYIDTSAVTKGQWQKVSGYLSIGDVPSVVGIKQQISVKPEEDGNVYYFDNPILIRVTEAYDAKLAADAAQADADTANTALLTKLEAAVFKASAQAGSNLIANPSFHDTSLNDKHLARTAYTGWSFDSSFKRSGTQSLKFVGPAGTAYPAINMTPDLESDTFSHGADDGFIPVSPGQVFYLSCWVYADPSNTGNNRIRHYLWGRGSVSQAIQVASEDISGGVWTQVSGYVTIPSGRNLMVPRMASARMSDGVDDGDTFWYDDFECYEITEAYNAAVDAATAQGTANTAVTNAATADAKAVTAQSAADTADAKAVAVRTSLNAALQGGDNICTNPGFEDIGQPISYSAVHSYSTEVSRNGTHSLKAVSNGSTYAAQYLVTNDTTFMRVPTSGGDVFYCEYWIYGHPSNTQVGYVSHGHRILAQYRDYNGDYLYSAGAGYIFIEDADDFAGVWTKKSGYITIPDDDDIATVDFFILSRCADIDSGDIYYYDDVVVKQVKDAVIAQGAASDAQGTANTAVSNAATADAKAIAAQFDIDVRSLDPENLVAGSSFEANNPWPMSGGMSVVSDQAYAGSKSLKLAGGVGGYNSHYPVEFEVRPGEQFYVEFYARRDAAFNHTTPGDPDGSRFRLTRDSQSTFKSFYFTTSVLTNPDTWYKISGFATAPSDVGTHMKAMIFTPPGSVSGNVWLDEITVRRVKIADTVGELPQDKITDLTTDLPAAQSTASTALTNAATADSKADAADAKAVEAQDTIEASAASTNLVISPNFEDDWVTRFQYGSASLAYVTSNVYQGDRSLRWTSSNSTWTGVYLSPTPNNRDFLCNEGDTFRLRGWLRAAASNSMGAGFVRVYFRFKTIDGSAYSDDISGAYYFNNTTLGTGGAWWEIDCYGTCPAGRDLLQVFIISDPNTPNGNYYYIDAMSLHEVSTAKAALDTADDAVDDAATAQGTANTANTNAGIADGKAEAAQETADDALPHSSFDSYLVGANNIVVNPTFEDDSFYVGPASYSTTHKHWGSQSLKMTGTGVDHQYARLVSNKTSTLRIQATAGQYFYIEYWVYAPASNVGSGYGRACTVGLWCYDSSAVSQQVFHLKATVDEIGEGSWVKKSSVVGPITDADVTNAIIYILLDEDVPVGDDFYFDDIVVKEVTEAVEAQDAADTAQGTANTADGKADDNETAIDQVGEVLVGEVVTPVNSAVSNIVQFFANLLGWQANSNAAQVAAISNTSQRNPVWVSRHPVADVSFPESLLLETALLNSTGAATAGTAHTHPLSDGLAQAAVYSVDQETSRGAYVTVGATVLHTHIGMMLRKSAGTALNNVFLEVYRESADGGLTLLESHDVASELDTSAALIEVELDEAIVAQAGERYLVRVWNDSSVATQLWAQCILNTSGMQKTGWWTGNAGTTENTSYSSGDATTHRNSTSRVAFAELASPDASAADAAYSDDFNDRSSLGNQWLTKSSSSNQLTVSFGKVAYSGITSGNQNGLYIYPTSSDRMFASAYLSTISLVVGDYVGIITNANRDLSQVVVLAVNGLGTKIYSGAWNSLTQRATTGTGGTGTYSIEYDPATGIYTGRKNGSSIITWNDSGDLMDHGSDNRYGGLRIVDTGGTIDNFVLKDFVPG